MRRRTRPILAGAAAFVLATGVGFVLFGADGDDPPSAEAANPGALAHIARKNDAAATRAAADMKADSESAAEASDALADARDTSPAPQR